MKTPPPANPGASRRAWTRRRWVYVAMGGGIALVLLMVILLIAATYRPRWYRPVPVDPAHLRDDKAALAGLEERISAALNAGQEIKIELREDQVNRWLAGRDQIWPHVADQLGPLQEPQISLHDGEIRLGCSTTQTGLTVVAVLTCQVAVTPDTVVVHFEAPRLGALPAPRRWLARLLDRLPPDQRVGMDDTAGTITFDNDWVWPNGKRRCRLRELQVADGVATAILEPLAGPGRIR